MIEAVKRGIVTVSFAIRCVKVKTEVCWTKESFIIELNPSWTIVCWLNVVSNNEFSLYVDATSYKQLYTD